MTTVEEQGGEESQKAAALLLDIKERLPCEIWITRLDREKRTTSFKPKQM